MDSNLATQTIARVVTSFATGVARIDVTDTANYKQYTVLFYSNITATDGFVDNKHVKFNTQALAYINGKIFSFCINDASGDGRFLNGDLTIKRIDIPTALKNPNALTFTGAATGTYDGSVAKTINIPKVPTSLKNPNALTIKIGSETITYDGSAAKTVEIADGTEVSY